MANKRPTIDAQSQVGCRHRKRPTPTRCTCGYNACCDIDFDEHVVALMHDDESHFEARQ